MSESRTRELVVRAAVDAVGPLLAQLERRLAEAEARAVALAREVELLRTERREAPAPRDGKDGKDGRDGTDGRDATFREPLDYEPGKLYPFDSIVRHRAGLWHSHRATDLAPETERSGWTLICAGLHAARVTQSADARSFEVVLELSSGAPLVHRFSIPALVYRGVHKSETTYLPGDVVTLAGSLWVARHETDRRPGNESGSEHWTLAVKKGTDGRDGDKGADAFTFRGYYDPGASYPPNAIVRTSSGLWLTTRATREAPPAEIGNGESKNWTLFLPTVTH